MATSLSFGAILVLSALCLAAAQEYLADTEKKLVDAINQANKNAVVCGTKKGCLGKQVTVKITRAITLSGPLPSLRSSANVRVVGFCGDGGRFACTIDAQGKFLVFPPQKASGPFGGPWARLEVSNLIFQHAKWGVFSNVWAQLVLRDLSFQENTGGVIVGNTKNAVGGFPPITCTRCLFVNNAGGVIILGNRQFGLSNHGIAGEVGLTIRNTTFDLNGSNRYGGTINLAGKGTSVFENVDILTSKSNQDGGAVYLDSTTALFRNVRFDWNRAQGRGGAVAGVSSWYGKLFVSFCNSNFGDNSAYQFNTSNNLFFESFNGGALVPMKIQFADTPIPTGSQFVQKNKKDTVTVGQGRKFYKNYC